MDIWILHNLVFALTFNLFIFGYDFISIFSKVTQYMMHDEKNYNKNFNQQIIMDF